MTTRAAAEHRNKHYFAQRGTATAPATELRRVHRGADGVAPSSRARAAAPAAPGWTPGPAPQVAGYSDFLSTQPPLFSKTEDPLDADAWIRTIESKFALLTAPYSEASKDLFAAQ